MSPTPIFPSAGIYSQQRMMADLERRIEALEKRNALMGGGGASSVSASLQALASLIPHAKRFTFDDPGTYSIPFIGIQPNGTYPDPSTIVSSSVLCAGDGANQNYMFIGPSQNYYPVFVLYMGGYVEEVIVDDSNDPGRVSGGVSVRVGEVGEPADTTEWTNTYVFTQFTPWIGAPGSLDMKIVPFGWLIGGYPSETVAPFRSLAVYFQLMGNNYADSGGDTVTVKGLHFEALLISQMFDPIKNAGGGPPPKAGKDTITVTVTDGATTHPIQNAVLNLFSVDSGYMAGSQLTNAAGVGNINGLADGSYNLQVSAIGYSDVNKPLSLMTGGQGGNTPISIVMYAGSGTASLLVTVNQNVVGVLSGALPGASVTLKSDSGNKTYSGITAVDGTVTFTNLEAGYWDINVSAPGFTSIGETKQILSGQAATATFTLNRNMRKISVRVNVAGDGYLGNASVVVTSSAGQIVGSTLTDVTGATSFIVNPGLYTVTASKAGYLSNSTSIDVTNQDGNVALPMQAVNATITVYVYNQASKTALSGVSVAAYFNGVYVTQATTDGTGRAVISGLVGGQVYTLTASPSHFAQGSIQIAAPGSGTIWLKPI